MEKEKRAEGGCIEESRDGDDQMGIGRGWKGVREKRDGRKG